MKENEIGKIIVDAALTVHNLAPLRLGGRKN